MPQTMYNRPWPSWVAIAVALLLTGILIAVAATQGLTSLATWAMIAAEFLAFGLLAIFDPEVTIESQKTLPDGRLVTVRRPIVGFKKHERQVGVTGGYEVRVDGYRYEEAYIRI